MTRKEIARWQRKLSAAQARVAKERDLLRLYLSDIEELSDRCDDAERSLQSAIDSLSELV